jgi:hypothetical protein
VWNNLHIEYRMASDQFKVTVSDMRGRRVPVDCTPNTPISDLLNKFRVILPSMQKRQVIALMKDDLSRVDLSGTVGTNNISGGDNLEAFYMGILSCINPDPIAEKLHHFIVHNKQRFPFKAVMKEQFLPEIDCTELVAEHNNWNVNEESTFILTTTRNPRSEIWVSDVITMSGYKGPIKYISGFEVLKGMPMTYTYSETQHDDREHEVEPQTLRYQDMESIKGRLDKIVLKIGNKKQSQDEDAGYHREFELYVILKGPIEICDPRGTVKYSSDDPTATCRITYDSIKTCDTNSDENQKKVNTRNVSQGGRRAKQTKRTKRSKNKRKMIRRTHKKRV